MKTYVPKRDEIEKRWHIIDAEGQVLGRVAAEAAKLLRGKHKAMFTPFLDCGDNVVIINAAKAKVTGDKAVQKTYYRHTGYVGGIKETTYREMLEKHPTRPMTMAVTGMLPKTRLGRVQATHLRVYADDKHPHEAQQPQPRTVG